MRAGLVALILAATPAASESLTHSGTFIWERPEQYFGGWSGIEVTDRGLGVTVIGDNAQIVKTRLKRDAAGAITEVIRNPIGALKDTDGIHFFRKATESDEKLGDSEGLAMLPAPGFAVSFERRNQVLIYTGEDQILELPPFPADLPVNAGVEALAYDTRTGLVAIPESVPDGSPGFPVWGYREGGWATLGHMRQSGWFRPTGADFGPDGRLYVLERAFRVVGFQSRVRVFDLENPEPDGVMLWTSETGEYDNLEGLSVWSDASGGVRLTMISDDNFNWFQQTQIVEFLLTE